MHQATLAIILTQISAECPCWSDYRAPYLLNQLMNVRRWWRCPPLCHAPGWSLSRQDVASAPFGIIITADLAGAHNYTSHSGPGRERDISAINRSSGLWNLADITQHTTAVWVSPTTATTPKWLTADNNTVILSQADMTVTTRDRIIGTREWAGRLRFIRSTNHWWRREGGRQEPIWVFALLIVQWN